MVKNKNFKRWITSLALVFLFAGSLAYALIGGFGSPENSNRQIDGPNGVGVYCEPPGSLCHFPV